MNKETFFKVWMVYQNHWGKEQQKIEARIYSCRLLVKKITGSPKMRALVYVYEMVKVMWEMGLFTHSNELADTIQNLSDACLDQEYSDTDWDIEPYERMARNIHLNMPYNCENVTMRQWRAMGRPKTGSVTNMGACIYRVSAIVALR